MLSAAGAAAPHLELAVILWSVFTALRTFTNAQSFVKLIVSGPKAAECEEDVAQRIVRRFFQLNPNLRPAGRNTISDPIAGERQCDWLRALRARSNHTRPHLSTRQPQQHRPHQRQRLA